MKVERYVAEQRAAALTCYSMEGYLESMAEIAEDPDSYLNEKTPAEIISIISARLKEFNKDHIQRLEELYEIED